MMLFMLSDEVIDLTKAVNQISWIKYLRNYK